MRLLLVGLLTLGNILSFSTNSYAGDLVRSEHIKEAFFKNEYVEKEINDELKRNCKEEEKFHITKIHYEIKEMHEAYLVTKRILCNKNDIRSVSAVATSDGESITIYHLPKKVDSNRSSYYELP